MYAPPTASRGRGRRSLRTPNTARAPSSSTFSLSSSTSSSLQNPQTPSQSTQQASFSSPYASSSSNSTGIVEISVPPGPLGILLGNKSNGPSFLEGFAPINNNGERGVVEISGRVPVGSVLVGVNQYDFEAAHSTFIEMGRVLRETSHLQRLMRFRLPENIGMAPGAGATTTNHVEMEPSRVPRTTREVEPAARTMDKRYEASTMQQHSSQRTRDPMTAAVPTRVPAQESHVVTIEPQVAARTESVERSVDKGRRQLHSSNLMGQQQHSLSSHLQQQPGTTSSAAAAVPLVMPTQTQTTSVETTTTHIRRQLRTSNHITSEKMQPQRTQEFNGASRGVLTEPSTAVQAKVVSVQEPQTIIFAPNVAVTTSQSLATASTIEQQPGVAVSATSTEERRQLQTSNVTVSVNQVSAHMQEVSLEEEKSPEFDQAAISKALQESTQVSKMVPPPAPAQQSVPIATPVPAPVSSVSVAITVDTSVPAPVLTLPPIASQLSESTVPESIVTLTVEAPAGPLGLNLDGSVTDKVIVRGFTPLPDGSIGALEQDGRIVNGSMLVQINDEDVSTWLFTDVVAKLGELAGEKRTLTFVQPDPSTLMSQCEVVVSKPPTRLASTYIEDLDKRRSLEMALVMKYDTDTITRYECWFLIHTSWMESWIRFVAQNGPLPGPISNETLLHHDWEARMRGKVPGRADEARANLEVMTDYRGVTPMVWCLFSNLYGSGATPPLARYTLDIYGSPLVEAAIEHITGELSLKAASLVQQLREQSQADPSL